MVKVFKNSGKNKKKDFEIGAKLVDNSEPGHVFIKTDSKLVQLDLNQVLWVEALGNYIRVHTENEKHTVLSTMKEIESKLPSQDFIRVQRSFIVRLDKVKSISDNYIIIKDKEIHIGKSYKEEFSKKSISYNLIKFQNHTPIFHFLLYYNRDILIKPFVYPSL